jgi:multidrug resistance efflux pump
VELTDFEVQAAEAKLQENAMRVDRLKRLFQSGVTSTGEYEEARTELKLREIDVKRARVAKEFFEQLLAEANKIVDQATTRLQDQPR